jgi:hypothetical protein
LYKIDPAGFFSVMDKMKNSPQEGFAALRELAEKHGITVWNNRGGSRRAGGEFTRPNTSVENNAVRSFNRPDLSALRRKYPEKMHQYDALRQKDPAKARALLLEIIKMDNNGGKK